MKIAVYAISKNESQFVDRFCESAKDADYIVIADTGSDDDTISRAKTHTDLVYNISIQPWRFDNARNASLALVPADADICICLDLDEVLEPGWKAEVLANWQANTTRMSYKFDWGSGVSFYSDKIHSRNGYAWRNPCHEVLDPKLEEVWVRTDFQLITHLPDNSKSRGSYLGLLATGYKETPNDARTVLYYGRELIFYSKITEAIPVLERFLTFTNVWEVEKVYAMGLLCMAERIRGNYRLAESWGLRAIASNELSRGPYSYLAKVYEELEDWASAAFYLKKALLLTTKPMFYMEATPDWNADIYDRAAIACYYSGDKRSAIVYGEKAIQISPNTDRLIANMNFYKA